MIRFACPSCQKVYKAPDDNAGQSIDCKKCGVRVVIPKVTLQKPVLGIALPSDGTVPPASTPKQTRKPEPLPSPAKSEDDGIPIRTESAERSLSRTANYGLLIFLSVVVPLVLLFAVIIFMVQRGKQVAAIPTNSTAPTGMPAPPVVNHNERQQPELTWPDDRKPAQPNKPAGRRPGDWEERAGGFDPPPPAPPPAQNRDRDDFPGVADKGEKKPAKPELAKPAKPEMDAQLTAIVQKLKSKEAKVRLAAIEELAAKGEAAAPAAKHLCDAMLDKNEAVALAALAAVEKVRPDLYKPLVDLCVDNGASRVDALSVLGKMGGDASPAANVIASRMSTVVAKTSSDLRGKGLIYANFDLRSASEESRYFDAISRIDPEHLGLRTALVLTAGAGNGDSFGRLFAIRTLLKMAGDDDTERKKLLPFLKSGMNDRNIMLDLINLYGELGPLSREMLPTLKRFKLSDSADVRKAADAAVAKIEGEK